VAAIDIICPYCHAQPADRCVTVRGREPGKPVPIHYARYEAWRHQQPRPPRRAVQNTEVQPTLDELVTAAADALTRGYWNRAEWCMRYANLLIQRPARR
jgi:hypothetical protein